MQNLSAVFKTQNGGSPLVLALQVGPMRRATLWDEASSSWSLAIPLAQSFGASMRNTLVNFEHGSFGFAIDAEPNLTLELTPHGVAFLSREEERVVTLVTKDTPLKRWHGGELVSTHPLSTRGFWPDRAQAAAYCIPIRAGDILEFDGPFGFLSHDDDHLEVMPSA